MLAGMFLDTAGLPDAKGQEIRDALVKYVSVVINVEWPIQREGKTPNQGWKPLRDLAIAIATIHPQNPGEEVIEAELQSHGTSSTTRAAPGSLPFKGIFPG